MLGGETVADFILDLGILAALAGGGYAGYVLGGKKKKEEIEGKIGRTEDAMKKLVDEATAKAEAVKKEKILEAKEEILRQKTETEKELRERRNETQRTERRLLQREEMLDKKLDNLEVREEGLNKTSRELEQRAQEVEAMRAQQQSELERIAQMTAEEARQIIMNNVQREAYHDAAVMVREIESTGQGRGRQEGPQHHLPGDSEVRGGPRGRDHGLRGQPAQRRHEGPHHRPRGAQHPHPGDRDGRRPDHRRHARGGHPLRL